MNATMSAALILTLSSVTASAAAYYRTIQINEQITVSTGNAATSYIPSGSVSRIYSWHSSNLNIAGTYALIFAAYDESGRLTNLEKQDITFDAAGDREFEPQTLNTDGAKKYG